MDALNKAKQYAQNLTGDGVPEFYERQAYKAMALALISIAEELQGIHEIMQWSDANERRVTEERAAAMAPSFEDMQRWEKEDDDAREELPY